MTRTSCPAFSSARYEVLSPLAAVYACTGPALMRNGLLLMYALSAHCMHHKAFCQGHEMQLMHGCCLLAMSLIHAAKTDDVEVQYTARSKIQACCKPYKMQLAGPETTKSSSRIQTIVLVARFLACCTVCGCYRPSLV